MTCFCSIPLPWLVVVQKFHYKWHQYLYLSLHFFVWLVLLNELDYFMFLSYSFRCTCLINDCCIFSVLPPCTKLENMLLWMTSGRGTCNIWDISTMSDRQISYLLELNLMLQVCSVVCISEILHSIRIIQTVRECSKLCKPLTEEICSFCIERIILVSCSKPVPHYT